MKNNFWRLLSKHNIAIIIIPVTLCVCGTAEKSRKAEEQITDWDNIRAGFEVFVSRPCPGEAKHFLETLPKDRTKNEKGDKSKALKLMSHGEASGILSNEIMSGNSSAIEAAFRLLNILENESLHHLRANLSHIIRLHPQDFLQFAYEYRDSSYMRSEGYPVSFFMSSYDQRWTARLFELEMRLKTLENVNEDRLREVKDTCILILNNEIRRLRSKAQVLEFLSRLPQRMPIGKELDELDKEKAISTAKAFLDYPSLENARALRNTIPKSPAVPITAYSPIDLEDDYWILENEAFAGNRYAVEVICRLLRFRDGIAGIIYEATLGNLIRINPRLYLQVVKEYQEQPHVFESARGYGLEYYPFEHAIACIYEARIQALQSVEDPDLLEIRDASIRYLRGDEQSYLFR